MAAGDCGELGERTKRWGRSCACYFDLVGFSYDVGFLKRVSRADFWGVICEESLYLFRRLLLLAGENGDTVVLGRELFFCLLFTLKFWLVLL
jgi:hypothetical protein